MKDIFAEKAKKQFFEVLSEFVGSLKATFPDCPDTQEWCLWFTNVVNGDDKMMDEGLRKWVDAMQTPLVKGCAKYMKAVQSIIGEPATVYHAISYRDATAADATSEVLRDLSLPEKLKNDTTMSKENCDVFWEYLVELNKQAYAALRKTPPVVPTKQQIADDIAKRKGGGASAAPSSSFKTSIYDQWTCICEQRKAKLPEEATPEQVSTDLAAAGLHLCSTSGKTVGEAPAEPEAFQYLCERFPYLDASCPPSDETANALTQLFGMVSMNHNIPTDMMKGIESVASKLAEDISNGKTDLASIDMEKIGKEVLSQVSETEVDAFASNMSALLPVLTKMTPGMKR